MKVRFLFYLILQHLAVWSLTCTTTNPQSVRRMVGCFQTTHLGSGGQLSFQAYRSIQYRRDLAFQAWCWLTGLHGTFIAIHNLGRALEHEQNLQEKWQNYIH